MECLVAWWGNPVGGGVRHHLPDMVFQERQRLGEGGSYVASTLYHSIKHHSKWKERLRKWDHAAIYWHIAGSYSPLTLVALREQGYWGWSLFIFVWTCALAGTIVSFIRLKEHSNLETFCFVGMGLSVLVAFKPLINSVPAAAHGSRILFAEQDEVYALRVPLLCSRWLRLSYHRRLGCARGVSELKFASELPQSLEGEKVVIDDVGIAFLGNYFKNSNFVFYRR